MADCLAEASARSIGKSNSLFHRPQHGVSPPAPRQRLASPGGSRQATGPRRRARTGRVAGDGQPALLGLRGGTAANYSGGLLEEPEAKRSCKTCAVASEGLLEFLFAQCTLGFSTRRPSSDAAWRIRSSAEATTTGSKCASRRVWTRSRAVDS
jgi:hypothetical protein